MKPQSQLSFGSVSRPRNLRPTRPVVTRSNAPTVSRPAIPNLPLEDIDIYSVRQEQARAERRQRVYAQADAAVADFGAAASLRLLPGQTGAEPGTSKNGGRLGRVMASATTRKKCLPCHWGLLVATLLLTILSIPLVYSASTAIALDQHKGDLNFFLIRQVIYSAIGLAVMVSASRLNLARLQRFSWIIYFAAVAGLVATKFGPLGFSQGNVERWVKIGPLTFQFSELAKIALIGVMADLWSRMMKDAQYRGTWQPWIASAGLAGVPVLLTVMQPHLSAALVLASLPIAIAVYAGVSWRQVGILFAGAGVLGILTIAMCCAGNMPLMKPYQQARIRAHFMGHGKDADQGDKYQAEQGKKAIVRGGWLGKGPGASLYKICYLPAPHTDFIYAVIGEEWGLVGTLGLLALYGALVFFCFQIGHSTQDAFGSLLCAGVGTLLGMQALGNIGVVTGIMPVTGMPLPLLTFGGSGLWCALLGIGLVLAVSRSHGNEEVRVPAN